MFVRTYHETKKSPKAYSSVDFTIRASNGVYKIDISVCWQSKAGYLYTDDYFLIVEKRGNGYYADSENMFFQSYKTLIWSMNYYAMTHASVAGQIKMAQTAINNRSIARMF